MYNIPEFDPEILEKKRHSGHSPIIVAIGKRGSGKSSIIEDLLYHLRGLRAVICMCPTEDSNGTFKKHIHELFIYDKFDEDVISNVIKNQKAIVKYLTKNGIDPKTRPEIGIGLILDDLNCDPKVLKNPLIAEILFNGRHLHITLIMTIQYMMTLPPNFRTNIDFLFVCRESKQDNIKRLYQYFFSMFENINDFKDVLSACTEDYRCLVINNTSQSNKIEDQVFWYKATLDRKYLIGSPQQRLQWDENIKNKEEEEFKNQNMSQKQIQDKCFEEVSSKPLRKKIVNLSHKNKNY